MASSTIMIACLATALACASPAKAQEGPPATGGTQEAEGVHLTGAEADDVVQEVGAAMLACFHPMSTFDSAKVLETHWDGAKGVGAARGTLYGIHWTEVGGSPTTMIVAALTYPNRHVRWAVLRDRSGLGYRLGGLTAKMAGAIVTGQVNECRMQ